MAFMAQIVGFVLFLAVGLLGAFWPRVVQAYELELYGRLNPIALTAFIRKYVQSEIYVWQMRLVGVLCLIAAAAMLRTIVGQPQ